MEHSKRTCWFFSHLLCCTLSKCQRFNYTICITTSNCYFSLTLCLCVIVTTNGSIDIRIWAKRGKGKVSLAFIVFALIFRLFCFNFLFSFCRMCVKVRKRARHHQTRIVQVMTNQHKLEQQMFRPLEHCNPRRSTIRRRVKRARKFQRLSTMCNPFISQVLKFQKVSKKLHVLLC